MCSEKSIRGKMEQEFKVAVESLHSNKIKSINYEGEETYQE